MITREHRFHGYGSLRYVYRRGRTVRSAIVSLKYISNDRRNTYRCAIVVSKKVSKSAIVRNRIRRRIYEIIRRNELQISGSYDLVFTVFNDAVATATNVDLERMIISLLQKAEIISTPTITGSRPLLEKSHKHS